VSKQTQKVISITSANGSEGGDRGKFKKGAAVFVRIAWDGGRKMSAVVISLAATPALAETPRRRHRKDPPASEGPPINAPPPIRKFISQQLRKRPDPASSRSSVRAWRPAQLIILDSRRCRNLPQGENAPLNQVLLQQLCPPSRQDSFGQIHGNGRENNAQCSQFRSNRSGIAGGDFRCSDRRSRKTRRFAPQRFASLNRRPLPEAIMDC